MSVWTVHNLSRYIFATHFESRGHLRSMIPSFDDPEMKATFQTTLVHPSALVALTNMPLVHTEEIGFSFS